MESILPEHEMYQQLEVHEDLGKVNIEKSGEFLISNRGNNLHVRTYWPENPVALVVFMHGYASHVNRPPHRHVAKQMLENNLAYVTIDFHGHGHSEGLKGYIPDDSVVIDDTLSFLFALYSDKNETEFYKISRNAVKSLPFFLMGHSMGGANAILVSNLFTDLKLTSSHTDFSLAHQKEILELSSGFQGAILLCPAIVIPKPPPFVVFLLSYILTPLLPDTPIPAALTSSDDNSIWGNEHYIKYVRSDQYPNNEAGLSWGGTLRFQTAHSILMLTERVQESLPHITYPFIVLSDRQDKVCKVEGADLLMSQSLTAPGDKSFVEVPGGLHDLLANKLGQVTTLCVDWVLDRLGKRHWMKNAVASASIDSNA